MAIGISEIMGNGSRQATWIVHRAGRRRPARWTVQILAARQGALVPAKDHRSPRTREATRPPDRLPPDHSWNAITALGSKVHNEHKIIRDNVRGRNGVAK